MLNQTIDGTKLKSVFDKWVSDSSNQELNPLLEVEKISEGLQVQLAKALSIDELNSIKKLEEGGVNWLIFKGVCKGIDKIVLETPTEFAPVEDSSLWWPIAQFTIGLLSACKFRAISYNSENNGALFQNLVAGTNPKSQGRLRGHTDAVAFPFQKRKINDHEISASPNFVVLSGIRNPKNVPTWLAPAQKIFSKLESEFPGSGNLLYDSFFDIEPQPSFDPEKLPKDYKLSDECIRGFNINGTPIMRFKNSGISVNSRHNKDVQELYSSVLKKMTQSLEADLGNSEKEIYEEVIVEPGDILIVNNRCAIHGRGKVVDDHEPIGIGGISRWLLRTYGYCDNTNGVQHDTFEYCMLP